VIRAARPEDRDAFYHVCLRCGDAGADATGLFDDPHLLGEVYVGPYLALQPDLALAVAADDDPEGTAQGYCLGALDSEDFARRCEESWWPILRARHPLEVVRREADQAVVGEIHRPPFAPRELVRGYPSHLHIDLLPSLRGQGAGSAAMSRQMTMMTAAGSTGVHLVVARTNVDAVRFYERLGIGVLGPFGDALVMGRSLA